MVAELSDGHHRGRGECVPYARYGETVEVGRRRDRGDAAGRLRAASTASGLQQAMPPGAARNALDCAFWDLEAKRAGRPAHELAGTRRRRKPLVTAYTISLGDARRRWRRPPPRPPIARCSR